MTNLPLIAGLPTAAAPTDALPAAALAVLQATCGIHLVELTHTHDSCYEATLVRKSVQHDLIVLAPPAVIFLLLLLPPALAGGSMLRFLSSC